MLTSSPARALAAWLAMFAAAMLAGCGDAGSDGPIRVSVIGEKPRLEPLGRDPFSPSGEILRLAIAQGLVARDATGQVEPGLAERWIVSDDGLSYIFRLRRTEWRAGKPVTANDLVRLLRQALKSRNWFSQQFSAVEEVVAVTPEILEIRLRAPRPHFLPLLAQPEMTLVNAKDGAGPFRIGIDLGDALLLAPIVDPDYPEQAQARRPVRLIGERAASAVARYEEGYADLVLGGTYATLPYARAIDPPNAQLRFDSAVGLFGLAVTAREGLLATASNRNAVAMAIDRDALVRSVSVPGWAPALSIVPARLDLQRDPALPDWAPLNRDARLALARSRIAEWRGSSTEFPRVRIALPDAAGSRLMFAQLASDLGQIGIIAERVAESADADLRLLDLVAPNDSATWYLTRLSCANGLPCSDDGDAALKASRAAPTLAERTSRLTDADAAYAVNMPFIPIAMPLRWSLVRPRIDGFQPNARAVHPLNRLMKN